MKLALAAGWTLSSSQDTVPPAHRKFFQVLDDLGENFRWTIHRPINPEVRKWGMNFEFQTFVFKCCESLVDPMLTGISHLNARQRAQRSKKDAERNCIDADANCVSGTGMHELHGFYFPRRCIGQGSRLNRIGFALMPVGFMECNPGNRRNRRRRPAIEGRSADQSSRLPASEGLGESDLPTPCALTQLGEVSGPIALWHPRSG